MWMSIVVYSMPLLVWCVFHAFSIQFTLCLQSRGLCRTLPGHNTMDGMENEFRMEKYSIIRTTEMDYDASGLKSMCHNRGGRTRAILFMVLTSRRLSYDLVASQSVFFFLHTFRLIDQQLWAEFIVVQPVLRATYGIDISLGRLYIDGIWAAVVVCTANTARRLIVLIAKLSGSRKNTATRCYSCKYSHAQLGHEQPFK